MDISFYTAGTGAKAHQTKIDVVSNNVANVNTYGYKNQRAAFVDLLYSNVREPEATDTQLRVGSGARVETTDIDFSHGGFSDTGNPTDYAIVGEGFFAVQNPETEEVRYTRDGNFRNSLNTDGKFYLVTSAGDYVLDAKLQKIEVNLSGRKNPKFEERTPGVFDFKMKDGLTLLGENLFVPSEKNGEAFLVNGSKAQQGYLEASNVDTANEMVRLIEAQRAYTMSLKMIQTSNEIEQTIESLRG